MARLPILFSFSASCLPPSVEKKRGLLWLIAQPRTLFLPALQAIKPINLMTFADAGNSRLILPQYPLVTAFFIQFGKQFNAAFANFKSIQFLNKSFQAFFIQVNHITHFSFNSLLLHFLDLETSKEAFANVQKVFTGAQKDVSR